MSSFTLVRNEEFLETIVWHENTVARIYSHVYKIGEM